jgi:hypothetical protein
MQNIKDKEALKKLYETWKTEMSTRNVDWNFIGINGIIRLCWWNMFAHY